LKDKELVLLFFVLEKQEKDAMTKDSFVLLMRDQISVFDEKENEIARFSGIFISKALLLDSNYLYV